MKSSRFDYVKYDEQAAFTQEQFKNLAIELEKQIEAFPNGRAKSLALTSLEETYMWIGKMVRDDQVSRNKETELNETRDPGAEPFALKYLKKGSEGYTLHSDNLCPYKAPEQIQYNISFISRNFRIMVSEGSDLSNTKRIITFGTHDYNVALQIEAVLIESRIVK